MLVHKLRVYLKFYILQLKAILSYKYSFLLTTILDFFTPLFFIAVWSSVTVLSKDKRIGEFDQYSIIAYFLIGALLQKFTSTGVAKDIIKIIKGKSEFSVSFFLLNDINFCITSAITFLARITGIMLISSIALILIIFLFPQIGKVVSNDHFNILFFIIFSILGFICLALFYCLIGLLRFYFISAGSLRNLLFNITAFLSGQFIPLAFLPDGFKTIVTFLPFSFSYYFPLSIILNKKTKTEILLGFVICLLWILFFAIICRKLYIKGVKYYDNLE